MIFDSALDRFGYVSWVRTVRMPIAPQFHWWSYDVPYYLDALSHLQELKEEGKIRHVGLTNFDTKRLEIITDKGIKIASNQVMTVLGRVKDSLRRPFVCVSVAVFVNGYFCPCLVWRGTLMGLRSPVMVYTFGTTDARRSPFNERGEAFWTTRRGLLAPKPLFGPRLFP